MKPIITLEEIQYTPHYENAESYTVYAVNGAIRSPWMQFHAYCSHCGKGSHFRVDQDYWIQLKCPICDGIFALYENDMYVD